MTKVSKDLNYLFCISADSLGVQGRKVQASSVDGCRQVIYSELNTSQIHCVQDGLIHAHSSCLHNFCPKGSLEWILYISETMIEVSIKTVINDFVF